MRAQLISDDYPRRLCKQFPAAKPTLILSHHMLYIVQEIHYQSMFESIEAYYVGRRRKHISIVKILLAQSEIIVDPLDAEDRTPLFDCAKQNEVEGVRTLLQKVTSADDEFAQNLS
jgi:hypothetical protein